MTGKEAIAYIERYTWSTTRLGLGRTRALLHALGDPQEKLRFIHVAGSNGKGSTCAMLERIMRCAGYRTGLYISPYIQQFGERMQVSGENIGDGDLAALTERVRAVADAMADHPSQFELVTAIAMLYFLQQRCDIVVLEVGMGGALDSTNVIPCPEAAVITNLGLEHTEYLGSTLAEIAAAKGGIIKSGGVAVCYECDDEAMAVLQAICREKGAKMRLSREGDAVGVSRSLDGQRFIWDGRTYDLPLLGAHQLRNAAVVLETVQVLREKGWCIQERAVQQGLRQVQWPARFEILRRKPLYILDGGHNPQCAQALARNLADYLPGQRVTFLLGVLRDKDYRQILGLIAPYAEKLICVTPDSPRALTGAELAAAAREMGLAAESCDTIEDGVARSAAEPGPVVAFGSLYLAGRVRTVFPLLEKGEA